MASVPGGLLRYAGLISVGSIEVMQRRGETHHANHGEDQGADQHARIAHEAAQRSGARRRRRSRGRFESDGVGGGAQ